MIVFIMSPHVCFYYVTKWGRCCSVFNGQAAHPVIPCCGCPHQITIPNNNNLSFKSQSQIKIIKEMKNTKIQDTKKIQKYKSTKIQKYKNTKIKKIQKYKSTKIQKNKNTKSGGRCRQVPYNWLYNGQSKAKRSIRHQRQWLDHRPPLFPRQRNPLFPHLFVLSFCWSSMPAFNHHLNDKICHI